MLTDVRDNSSDEQQQPTLKIEMVDINTLIPYARNPRNNKHAIPKVAASIKEFGFRQPIVVDKDNTIVVGHTRWEAAKLLNLTQVPVHRAMNLTPQQIKAYRIADNKTNDIAEWDNDLLSLELEEIDGLFTGFDEDEIKKIQDGILTPTNQKLSDKFGVPPFSVLDAKQKYWIDRKQEWREAGIEGHSGRSENLIWPTEGKSAKYFQVGTMLSAGTSLFDPVLTEILYRWFSKRGSDTLDPFAGGITRGAVGAILGRNYTGIDLSKQQVEVNREDWAKLKDRIQMEGIEKGKTEWIIGDSTELDKHLPAQKKYDFILTCPPYGDLEQYSDDENDLSNKDYKEFIHLYEKVLTQSVQRLNEDRFCAIVVGDFRDKKTGNYNNFVGDTIRIMLNAGTNLYNEAILYTSIGSLSMRVERQFRPTRKLGKTHQNVLVFVKGDSKKAVDWAEVEMSVQQGELIKDHAQILVFVKGDGRKATEYLGPPENFTTFEQDLFSDE